MTTPTSCRGHATIELAIGGAIGGVLLTAVFALHAQQRMNWATVLRVVDASARVGEAARAIELAARAATSVRIEDARPNDGHRISLHYAMSPLSRSEEDEVSGLCEDFENIDAVKDEAGHGSIDAMRSNRGVSNAATVATSHWFVRARREAGEGEHAWSGVTNASEKERSELYCERGHSGYASPVVTDIGAIYGAWHPARDRAPVRSGTWGAPRDSMLGSHAVATGVTRVSELASLDVCIVPLRDVTSSTRNGTGCDFETPSQVKHNGEGIRSNGEALVTRVALRSRVVSYRRDDWGSYHERMHARSSLDVD
jgi:hypothetical protein